MDGPIAIVGYMGCGKTTVGRLLARRLGWSFVDLDRVVVSRAGLAIPEIFARHGERWFRVRERAALLEALEGPPERVVALGGGGVLLPENREALGRADTIFLEEDPMLLFERTRSGVRPLRGDSFEKFLARYRRRLPLYQEVASRTVHVEGRPPNSIVAEVTRCATA